MPLSAAFKLNPLGSEPGPQWPDEDLVRACLDGDQAAWAALVEKYRNLVYSIPYRYRMPAEDAADVFQAVWIDLYNELPRLRSVGALRGWLARVAANKCYRWKHRRTADPLPEADLLPAPLTKDALEVEQSVRESMTALPDRCQQMVQLLFFEDPPLPYAEVAKRLGLAEGSIGFIRGRCLDKLRVSLEKSGYC